MTSCPAIATPSIFYEPDHATRDDGLHIRAAELATLHPEDDDLCEALDLEVLLHTLSARYFQHLRANVGRV